MDLLWVHAAWNLELETLEANAKEKACWPLFGVMLEMRSTPQNQQAIADF
jgi:hypothetical protein